MKMKIQFRHHLRWIAAGVVLAGTALALLLIKVEAPTEEGVKMTDIPYYQLPFGLDENGNERPFWPSRMTTANGRMSDPVRIPSALECAECHQQEFDEWAPSLHAVAGIDAIYDKTEEVNAGLLRHGTEQGRFCEGCHAPGELLSGRTNRFVSVAPSDALMEGVSCIACHTAVHADPVAGNGALTLAINSGIDKLSPALILAAPRDHARAFGAVETNDLIAKPEFCGACHTETYDRSMSRAEGDQTVQATFEEWKDSWYAKNDVTCQDCHMAPDPADYVMQLRKGKVAKPERFSLCFVGANYLMFDTSLGSNLTFLRGGLIRGLDRERQNKLIAAQGEATKRLLRTAARLELRGQSKIDKGMHLDIAVQNLGAGHNLPTGVTDQKHMWLEVVVKNAKGETVFHSGGYDALLGATDPDAVAWIEEFLDEDGNRILDHLTFVTAAVTWQRVTIPPRGEDVVGYDIPLPEGETGPFTLEARLWYRVALQEMVFNNLKIDMPIPPFELTSLTSDLSGTEGLVQ